MATGAASTVPSLAGAAPPLPTTGGRTIVQIKALVRKDFQVMKAHARAMVLELVFPLMMGTLSCLFLSVFLNQSGYTGHGYVNLYCNDNNYAAYGPPNMTNAALLAQQAGTPLAYCGGATSAGGWMAYDDETSLLASYTAYVNTLSNVNGDSDYRLGTLMYFQNFSTPHHNINVYQTHQVQSSECTALGRAVNALFNGGEPHVNIQDANSGSIQQFNIRQTFATAGAIMLSFAFLPMTTTMAGRLVDEKKAKVREHLRVMGVSSGAYLLAAFLVAMFRVGFVSLSMLILIGSFNIVHVSSLFGIWIALVCYGFSLAAFAQIMPAFFSRPTMSNAACSVFIALTSVGAVFASEIHQLTPLLAFLFSPSAFVYATAQLLNNNFARLEITPTGAVVCLVWQMVMYAGVSQYLYNINPGEFGVPRHPLFPFHDLMSFVRGACGGNGTGDRQKKLKQDGLEQTPLLSGSSPSAAQDRIVLENLVKVFGNEYDTPAVNKLSLRVREREIFALLGHNGAGKTTTISMLIGMLTSTSYDVAEVLGYDLNSDLDAIRQHIGICPQFDVLFDDLSARQHLDLYAAVKGRPLLDGDTLLRKLKLPLDDQKASTFSGGMKRRLSVGNALVGDAPILFLDEPSSGLDPVSRRQLWELLREEKITKGKTIVLTTHFMEEADYLGDRIAIMSHGRLYCCDTSANLKATYGVGYYLNLAKQQSTESAVAHPQNHAVNQREDDTHPHHHHGTVPFNKALASDIINRYTNDWSIKQESIGDVTFLLPPSALPTFGDMLQEIETNLEALGCSSYGVAMNSLEDVFVNISEREAAATAAAAGKQVEDTAMLNTTTTASGVPLEELFQQAAYDGCLMRFFSQCWTVYVKKWMSFSRSARMVVSCVIIPIIMVGIGFGAAIPNFANQNNGGGSSYNYYAQYDSAQWPDDAHAKITIFQESDTWSAALNEVVDEFYNNYIAYETAVGRTNPTLTLNRVTASEFSVGAFLGGGSISFLTTYNPVLQIGFLDDMNTELTDPVQANASLVYYYGSDNWAGMYMMPIAALMHASIEAVWRRNNGDATPVRLPVGVPFDLPIPPLNNTATPSPPTSTVAPTGSSSSSSSSSDDNGPPLILIPLAVLVNVCIGQFIAGIMLPIADELNRHVYHTLRLHGLSAAAFWIGTFAFDLTTGMSIVVAYIGGCYARGVTQIQNDLLVYQCLVLVATIGFGILLAYAIVLVLPENLKPSTYMYAATGVYYLTLLIPMIIYVAMLSTGSNNIPVWLEVVTPSRGLLAGIIEHPHVPSHIWVTHTCINTWVAMGIWIGLLLAVLVYQSYVSPRMSVHSPTPSPTVGAAPTTMQPGQPLMAPLVDGGAASVLGSIVEDPDVTLEAQRVVAAMSEAESDAAGCDTMAATVHLRKVFHGVSTVGSQDRGQSVFGRLMSATADKVAVRDLTFGIRSGECFGLLGPNGAGKTTTVKMMMREVAPSAGSVAFPYAPGAADVNRGCMGSIDSAYQLARLGACQQGDTLWESFNAAEHMRLYLRIRLGGFYNDAELDGYIENAIKKVALEEAKGKPAGSYSGGMKRKLSVCIAMYTGARTVFLDEPSTGMDPYARRALWRSINEALQNDRCVLLTTHSMEEADAVCARIGIVTNGVMQCIGNSQHLKNRFGSGYSIVVTLHPRDGNGAPVCVSSAADTDETALRQLTIESPVAVQRTEEAGRLVDAAMFEAFAACGCELKEVLGLQRRYAVGKLPALSVAFRTLHAQQAPMGIANYSISQLTSLEHIFINFAGSAINEAN